MACKYTKSVWNHPIATCEGTQNGGAGVSPVLPFNVHPPSHPPTKVASFHKKDSVMLVGGGVEIATSRAHDGYNEVLSTRAFPNMHRKNTN